MHTQRQHRRFDTQGIRQFVPDAQRAVHHVEFELSNAAHSSELALDHSLLGRTAHLSDPETTEARRVPDTNLKLLRLTRL